MTTIDAAFGFVGRRLVARSEANARRRRAQAGSALLALWHLLLVVGGLCAVTYGVYQLAEWAGWIVGGLGAFVLRSVVTWEPGGADAPRR